MVQQLGNSTRRVLKATYVPLKVDADPAILVGRAIEKYGYVRQLALQPGEVSAARTALSTSVVTSPTLWETLTKFEANPLPAQLPSTDAFATTATADLTAFGNALISVRQSRYDQLRQPPARTPGATVAPVMSRDRERLCFA
jgi:hypothetical protein